MTVETLTLTEFLLARIAEDEAVARESYDDDRWIVELDGNGDSWVTQVDRAGQHWRVAMVGPKPAEHIARHDPARIMAECMAKRLIVTDPQPDYRADYHGWHITKESMLRYIALPYADHPDYRQEWRP